VVYAGKARYCPVCQSHTRFFRPFGVKKRSDAMCPVCRSLERHRLVWLYLQQTNLFDPQPKNMLHIAPETAFAPYFSRLPHLRYISSDLEKQNIVVRMDLMSIAHPDETFDIIYCSHVLEHIDDDRQAMREMRRVLRRGGWALIDVPITVEHTFEDPTVTDYRERERLFGQFDHVRRYGPDIADRLREAGFHTQVLSAQDIVASQDMNRLGIKPQSLFICTR
jgi:SAM-dependent methyltransferase